MRVCDQYTDKDQLRFFSPVNHEMEVHSSVDLSPAPVASALDIDRVITRLGHPYYEDSIRFENPVHGIVDEVRLGQDEQILSIASYPALKNDVRKVLPVPTLSHLIDESILEDVQDGDGLDGLSHMLVEIDCTRNVTFEALAGTAFEGSSVGILPVDEPTPVLSEEITDYEKVFRVKAFINDDGQYVAWRSSKYGGPNKLIDLCIMNAYLSNNIELGMLKHAIGYETTLRALLHLDPVTATYLRQYDGVKPTCGMNFYPANEPTELGYSYRFPMLNDRELNKWSKLIELSNEAMSTPRNNL